MLASLLQFRNAPGSINVVLIGISIFVNFIHPWKAISPIVSTVFGNFISSKLSHNPNALISIVFNPSFNVIFDKLVQFRNASAPSVASPLGVTIVFIFLQSAKAFCSILVTPSIIVNEDPVFAVG